MCACVCLYVHIVKCVHTGGCKSIVGIIHSACYVMFKLPQSTYNPVPTATAILPSDHQHTYRLAAQNVWNNSIRLWSCAMFGLKWNVKLFYFPIVLCSRIVLLLYRVLLKTTGGLGLTTAKQYDRRHFISGHVLYNILKIWNVCLV